MMKPIGITETEEIKSQEFSLLVEEYKLADSKVEDYHQKQLNYLNVTIVLLSGFLFFLIEKNQINVLKVYFPYFSFLIYGTLVYHFRRNLIIQGHRKFLAKKINSYLNNNVILFPDITTNYSLSWKKNWFLTFNTIAWMLILCIIFCYAQLNLTSSYGRIKIGINSYFHFIFQGMIIFLFIGRFVMVDRHLEKEIEEYSEINFIKN